ncbi:MAG: ATP-dependent Clp protease adaptor ClpS [Phycisphaerales bacterium]
MKITATTSDPPRQTPRCSDDDAASTSGDGPSDVPSVAVVERPAPAPPRVERMPLWRVLLHNDNDNFLEDVVTALQEIAKLKYTDALQRTLEAHHQGVALVLTTHREHAELLAEQFDTKLLCVSIEPEV